MSHSMLMFNYQYSTDNTSRKMVWHVIHVHCSCTCVQYTKYLFSLDDGIQMWFGLEYSSSSNSYVWLDGSPYIWSLWDIRFTPNPTKPTAKDIYSPLWISLAGGGSYRIACQHDTAGENKRFFCFLLQQVTRVLIHHDKI